ncbi:hypothetical protein NGRA_1139 [Nosema granulosis]|uniref:Uncharacterized protein n=1 Tax=Nosema granulosis TaxID=83296 RepID=A0A9P6GYZ1_9MICR|nr:hypothetical protein NGRA_1139 [Nosema granulosis]
MKIEFQGIKKTKKTILEKLMQTSDSIDSLKNALSSLNIFSSIEEKDKNKIKVVEDKSRINISSNSEKNNSLNISLTNLFGRAINSKINISNLSNYSFKISSPIIANKLFFLNFSNTKSLLNLPCGSYGVNKSDVGLVLDNLKISMGLDSIQGDRNKYLSLNYTAPSVGLNIKQDLTSPFTKIEAENKLSVSLLPFLKHSLRIGVGCILGKSPQYERFFLGRNIRGYKDKTISPVDFNVKNGGLSYIEVTNRLILNISKINLYLFNSLGYNSRQQNLVNTARETYKEIRNMNNSAFGLSVGVGACVPLSNDSGTKLDAALSFPLTNNKNVERYQFDLNFDF